MSIIEKFLMGVVTIGMATTVLLPDRQTVGVLGAVEKLITGALGTAMGTRKG